MWTARTRAAYNSVNYKAGVEYDLAPRSMAYANISTGFKSGGFYVAPPPNTFSPEDARWPGSLQLLNSLRLRMA
jgi:outer membrane receptor protein involved in Fe transport